MVVAFAAGASHLALANIFHFLNVTFSDEILHCAPFFSGVALSSPAAAAFWTRTPSELPPHKPAATDTAAVMPKEKIVLYQVTRVSLCILRCGAALSLMPRIPQYNVCPFCCKVKAFLDFHRVKL
jgi:hypothetical protein